MRLEHSYSLPKFPWVDVLCKQSVFTYHFLLAREQLKHKPEKKDELYSVLENIHSLLFDRPIDNKELVMERLSDNIAFYYDMIQWPCQIGEEYREEFEREYGKDKKTGYGQWLDMFRMPHNGRYRNMATEYAWKAFRHGKGIYNPNTPIDKTDE